MLKRLLSLYLQLVIIFLILRCAHLKKARQSYQNNDFKKTISLCKQAVTKDSLDGDAYLLLAQSYLAIGYSDSAFQTLEKNKSVILSGNKHKNDVISLYIETGEIAYKKDKTQRAILCFESAELLNPESPEFLKRIAEFDYNRGQLDKAREKFVLLKDSDSDSSEINSRIDEIDSRIQKADTFLKKGLTAIKQGSFAKAEKYFDQSLKQKPDFTEAKYHKYMAHGRQLLRKGAKSVLWDAIENFGLAMTLKPGLAEPHYRMAQAYEKKSGQEFVNAIDEYQEALNLEPDGPYAAASRKKIRELTKRKEKLDRFWGR